MKAQNFDGVLEALQETRAHLAGHTVPGTVVHIPPSPDVAALRRRTGLSQAAFGRRIGVSAATLRNWEQGRRQPDGAARVLLALLAKNPALVEEMLGTAVAAE